MLDRMIDGGAHNRPKVVNPLGRDTRSADRAERDAATPPRAAQAPGATAPLRAAASETDRRVATATTARRQADALQALPLARRPAMRGELEQARSEASQAEAAATRAASEELRIAKQVLTPAHFERYESDLASAQPSESVAKAMQQSEQPAPSAPDPLQTALDKANRAQANYERLSAAGAPSDSYNTHVIEPAHQQAEEAWKEVDALVSQDLQRTLVASQTPYSRSPSVQTRADTLAAKAPDNARFSQIVDDAAARASGGAIAADVEKTYRLKGADAAAARLDSLTANSSPEVAREAILAL